MAKKPIKITEVVLRDAHQSLLATRMTMDEMRPILPEMDKIPYFSVECWGGATFDTCLRYLDEDPWERLRGLRTLRAHMDVLEGQLKALAAADAATDANLWVMAPMVADQHEADYFVKLGKSFGLKFVGAMAEVPSIALMADKVADVADFVSIGTNDLTQYTLAADRTLGSVANYQTAWHPAVLRAIKMICDAGNAKGMPVGVCGEAAADPDLAVVLAGLGVNSLSMTPVALDDVRASLAEVTFEEAQARAEAALNGDFYHPAN